MAAFKHLSGGSGPGQKAEGCPGSARWPEIGTWGAARGKATPKPARPSGSPLPSSRPACPKPRAGCPPTLTPVYKHSPGAGWGGRDAGWRGGRGRWLRRTPPAARSEELVRESGARQLERTERLVFETVNSLNPYCEGFMQNISGLLK